MRKKDRYTISSDNSELVGRIYDLGIVTLSFESYDEASKYADVKYVLDINEKIGNLVDRVESLNHVGSLLWPDQPVEIRSLPLSAYDYCNIIQDTFLMRIVSVFDCCCLLTTKVLELNLDPKRANIANIKKLSGNHRCCSKLKKIWDIQRDLRIERNFRFHRGVTAPLTIDDTIFRSAAVIERWGRGVKGTDFYSRKISVQRFYEEAILNLRKKFKKNVKELSAALDAFYGSLYPEFEKRFRHKFRNPSSFGQKQRSQLKEENIQISQSH